MDPLLIPKTLNGAVLLEKLNALEANPINEGISAVFDATYWAVQDLNKVDFDPNLGDVQNNTYAGRRTLIIFTDLEETCEREEGYDEEKFNDEIFAIADGVGVNLHFFVLRTEDRPLPEHCLQIDRSGNAECVDIPLNESNMQEKIEEAINKINELYCDGSHIDCFDLTPTSTPTPSLTPSLTPTSTSTPTPTSTHTPHPSHTPTNTPSPIPRDAVALPTPHVDIVPQTAESDPSTLPSILIFVILLPISLAVLIALLSISGILGFVITQQKNQGD